ncbi:hypothetical protein [Halalkalibacterium halodurans]|uniref:hypothetical protein n=1 Tax=Halalkalibacterium halodurans TaxID=86665 RepID=UPI002AA97ED9|nr:hypothetical protein [Halalkalibacterium halodurans]MDY7221071.1 hypothetical protein [Halalkalibacterium halodurans]MDY7240310.1 hypothetical protein [Halalkalibacterium halodurans]
MNLLSDVVLRLALSIPVEPINVEMVKRGIKKFGFVVSFAYQAVTAGLELVISR